MNTKFGRATKRTDGYWHIVSTKEGNASKLLHRLIFEDFYNITLTPDTIIHHDDGDKNNNNIWNLIPMTQNEHRALHNYENNPMLKFKGDINYQLKLSAIKNNTNYFRVSVRRDSRFKNGFTYCYQYYDETGKRRQINSVDIKKLEEKVKSKGLEWIVLDEEVEV